ncbi:MAG TPA: penicillin-binding transpeptidase domain-containing protein [Ktedonobacteraceae bacterium]|jgi:cell division protein FtsI/penicillin-binding protein 2|nr:penicillin-binding transpeptidase domain-containing protein [Ktedonobacteraceae bacterium]
MNISSNIRKLTLFFIAFFIAASGGFVYWQVVVAQQVSSNIHNGRSCANAPFRGTIYDRNGVRLAYSVPSKSGCGYTRVYTDPSLAGLIGYYVNPLYSSTGIEHQYDSYLTGKVGLTQIDNLMNNTLHRPPVGDDIYLTIDERIQKIANQHFDDPITIDNTLTFPTNRGSVVVTDPHTGAILAMVSRPGYDPNKLVKTLANSDLSYYNQLNNDKGTPLLERPIQSTYIPGSIYKTMTLMAGLDSGKTTLNQPFNMQQAHGPLRINGQEITGSNLDPFTFHYPVSTEYGYSHSDNLIYAQIGVNTGQQTWLDYNKKFYVGQQIPFDLPVAKSEVLLNNQPLPANQLASDAFGQGYDTITPLQMSLIDNASADNGQLMRPMLISKVTDTHKNVLKSYTPTSLSNPISQDTATQVRRAMYGVTQCGSGSIVPDFHNSPWSIIGKTGTGQVGSSQYVGANSWMITQAPYSVDNPNQLPALSIVAMKENGGDGGPTVGPMIAHMYNDIFAQHLVPATLPPAPSPTYCCNEKLLQQGPGC